MQRLKKITSAPKKIATHVNNCRGRYCLAAGIIAGGVATRKLDNDTYKEAIAFIRLKGLEDEFFTPMEHDWQNM